MFVLDRKPSFMDYIHIMKIWVKQKINDRVNNVGGDIVTAERYNKPYGVVIGDADNIMAEKSQNYGENHKIRVRVFTDNTGYGYVQELGSSTHVFVANGCIIHCNLRESIPPEACKIPMMHTAGVGSFNGFIYLKHSHGGFEYITEFYN